MDQALDSFFQTLWDDLIQIAPVAASIRQSLLDAGEQVINDHVAFRTFDRGPIPLDALESHLLELGYTRFSTYRFEKKKLQARAFVHPDPTAPKVFVSALCVSELSAQAQAIIDGVIAQIPADLAATRAVFTSGRVWKPITYAQWQSLAAESEYAAWLCAHGLHANHFTISINELSPKLRSVAAVNAFVESLGFGINDAGGRVKGTPADLLEQGSTVADKMPVVFADGTYTVPTCYYEFALRYPMPDGTRYPGFVAASADKIFESTDVR